MDIICSAYLNGFKWPDYAWIFTEIINSEIFMDSKFCSRDTANAAMNKTIFLHPGLKTPHEYQDLPSGLNYIAFHNAYLELLNESATELNLSLQSNPYADVLYDSIWAFALTLNESLSTLKARNLSLANIRHAKRKIMDVLEEQLSELSFQGATGLLNFSQSAPSVLISVELFQFQNGQPVRIGSYNASLDQVILNESTLGEIPSDTLNRIYVLSPILLTVILSIVIVLCFVLTTVSMCLFFYYRKQPAIKATSSALSLIMFIGCYFLLTSSLSHTVTSGIGTQGRKEPLPTFMCLFNIYLFNIGGDIVTATVIAKTMRIYHIFKKFGKVNRIWSDQGLLILILIIVSIKIVLLTLWTCLDITHLVDKEHYISQNVPPYFLVRRRCQSNHTEIWLLVISTYSFVLIFIMGLLAVLTRKIKRGDFKDSKKINTLILILVFDICIFPSLWILFRHNGAIILSRVMYSVGVLIAAFSCQVFLILPKVLPLVPVLQRCRIWIEIKRDHIPSLDATK